MSSKLLILAIILSISSLSHAQFGAISDFTESLNELLANISAGLATASNNIGNTNVNAQVYQIEAADALNNLNLTEACSGCQGLVQQLRAFGNSDFIKSLIIGQVKSQCEAKVSDSSLCDGLINTYGDVVYGSIMDLDATPLEVCEGLSFCPAQINQTELDEYIQTILEDRPDDNVPTPSGQSTYNVLHLTDVHIDLLYQEGASSVCDGLMCCRESAGEPATPEDAAGYWGTVAACDLPERTFEQFLQFVNRTMNISMILWTGDNADHDQASQSKSNQTLTTYEITQGLKKYFPNTKIYPMFGNHEAYPTDQFDTVGDDSAYLTEELGEWWEPWLTEEAEDEFKKNSYYSIVDPNYNVKIISLDTQTCDIINFYLIRDTSEDPLDQLEWLRQELFDAETNGQGVFIQGHIPPGSTSCKPEWSSRYRALVDRFANTIRGQFFGHTHNDEFHVVKRYDDNETPVGTYYVAPSMTTYTLLNPSFRVFEVDAETNQPINYQQYRLNLTKWNQNTTGPIEWDLAYDFLNEYNKTDMSFATYSDLADEIGSNPETASVFSENFNSGAQPYDNLSQRVMDYYSCFASNSISSDAQTCLGLNPDLITLEYLISSFTYHRA